jgi:hypothetical protein
MFNNDNIKLTLKNSMSPTILLHSKQLSSSANKTYTDKIFKSVEFSDYKYFLKMWPVIDHTIVQSLGDIGKVWEPRISQCLALDYEKNIYEKIRQAGFDERKSSGIDESEEYSEYTLPLLLSSNGLLLKDYASVLNYTTSDYELFEWVFFNYLKDPRYPSIHFDLATENKLMVEFKKDAKNIQIINSLFQTIRFKCIITVSVNSVTLHNKLEELNKVFDRNNPVYPTLTSNIDTEYVDSIKELISIFIGIVLGLKTLKRSSIVHNDLHTGNIFVPRKITMDVYQTFIYDYDRSYTKSLGNNPYLDSNFCDSDNLCSKANCNIYDEWLDFFKILGGIFNEINPTVRDIIFKVLTEIPNMPPNEHYRFITTIQLPFLYDNYDKCCWYYNASNINHDVKSTMIKALVDYDAIINKLSSYIDNIDRVRSVKLSFKLAPYTSKNNEQTNSSLYKLDKSKIDFYKTKSTKVKMSISQKNENSEQEYIDIMAKRAMKNNYISLPRSKMPGNDYMNMPKEIYDFNNDFNDNNDRKIEMSKLSNMKINKNFRHLFLKK